MTKSKHGIPLVQMTFITKLKKKKRGVGGRRGIGFQFLSVITLTQVKAELCRCLPPSLCRLHQCTWKRAHSQCLCIYPFLWQLLSYPIPNGTLGFLLFPNLILTLALVPILSVGLSFDPLLCKEGS